MKIETREWIQKAEGDWQTARDLADVASRVRRANHDSVCFHCQQSAEKYLKALLQELGRVVPRTHDLETLLDLVSPDHPTLGPLLRILLILNPYAVQYRYPGTNAKKRQAQAAVRHAEKVRKAVRDRLGLRE